ncbi:hypothetical protein [Motiliproteus sediminis]|uniref:hypothetical protein n=1 Tax=Motiliproteus sediminis TaxID=1468178 RepID=UPI001AEFFBDA|nr:hypothetical protein [Motiliproteus sediminis]
MNVDRESYSHELVELGNQAWILNCALAELYRFQKLMDDDEAMSPALAEGRRQLLDPAYTRLYTRLQALMAKWTRRIAEQAGETMGVEERPWGIEVQLPDAVRQRLKAQLMEPLTRDEMIARADASPDRLFLCYPVVDADQRYSVWRFDGADISYSKMWWSWWLASDRPLCRRQALSDNLWLIDGCGTDWRDQLAGPISV